MLNITVPPNGPKTSYTDILKLAAPLILSMSAQMLLQLIDTIFLAWYSADALAAVMPAAMANLLLTSAFAGTAGYTATFVAQYIGAGRRERAAHTVWQGIYFSIISGLLLSLVALAARPLFAWAGHAPHIQAMEVRFFQITCFGALFVVLSSAVSGFFSGRGDTRTVMIVQLAGLALNALLDYVLIFGNFGAPRLGITGAALATVAAGAMSAVVFCVLFVRRGNREAWATWKSRGFEGALFRRMIKFGFPTGIRFSIEMAAWTVFIFFVGRIGSFELAATNMVWRINSIAFFPLLGLSQAISILVGNAQGARRPDLSQKVTYRGMAIAQGWMLVMAILFVAVPRQLLGIFNVNEATSPQLFAQMAHTGVILLRFVALYCLLDSFNYVFLATLAAAGDTRWTLFTTAVLNGMFIAALVTADLWSRTLITEWIIASAFVMAQALVWFGRFLQGKWKGLQLVEPRIAEKSGVLQAGELGADPA